MASFNRLFRLLALLLVFLASPLLILIAPISYAAAEQTATYYDILKLEPDATLHDIKKSYRKLAMEYHPDRNRGNEEESTLRFRQVSEAYEVLSDDTLRKEYDRNLKSGSRAGHAAAGGGGGGGGGGRGWSTTYRERYGQQHRDPFAQFDDLFRNDPFFKEAFDGLDDLFAKTFLNGGGEYARGRGSNPATSAQQHRNRSPIWGAVGSWAADKLGVNVEFSMTSSSSSTSTGNGRAARSSHSSSSTTTSSWGGGSGGGTAFFTSRSTRTVIENGKRITIQSLEKDGNRIEERYDGRTLVERKINGVPQRIEQIAGEDL